MVCTAKGWHGCGSKVHNILSTNEGLGLQLFWVWGGFGLASLFELDLRGFRGAYRRSVGGTVVMLKKDACEKMAVTMMLLIMPLRKVIQSTVMIEPSPFVHSAEYTARECRSRKAAQKDPVHPKPNSGESLCPKP